MPYSKLAFGVSYQPLSTYWLVEDGRKDQQENDVEKIDCSDRDVESIGLFVHPGSEYTDTNEESGLNYHQSDSLGNAAALSKRNED